jgi:hydrogenase maturation protease
VGDNPPLPSPKPNVTLKEAEEGRVGAVLILGLGNPLQRDDGVGCRVIEELERRSLPPGVEVLDAGTPGIGLLNLLEGRQRVLIVDAAEMGRQPGEFVRFAADEVTLTGSTERFSLHRTAVADALALAHALALPLPEIVFFGVQPAQIGWGEGLSPEVEAAVSRVVEALLVAVSGGNIMPKKKTHILIIDDDPDMVEAMRMALEAHRYKVSHAANGRIGLEMVKKAKPDLIVLDVMMDTATEGFQVSLALRSPDPQSEYAAFSRIPIIMLTSIHSTTPLRFGPDKDYLPVDTFLDKPIDPDVLLAKVAELTAKK